MLFPVLTLWFVDPVTVAENCVLSPPRSVVLGGVTVMPLEVEPELAPEFIPPPQPAHKKIARERTAAPVNFAPEDFAVSIISDPLS